MTNFRMFQKHRFFFTRVITLQFRIQRIVSRRKHQTDLMISDTWITKTTHTNIKENLIYILILNETICGSRNDIESSTFISSALTWYDVNPLWHPNERITNKQINKSQVSKTNDRIALVCDWCHHRNTTTLHKNHWMRKLPLEK